MPIRDQSYRRYQGRREGLGGIWTVIAWCGIRSLITQRRFLFLLLFAWLPFIVRAVQIYLAANFPQADILRPSPDTFRDFLDQQGFLLFFVTVYAGAGLIANDRRANALQIYLSKPLTRADYVAGKLAVLVSFQLLVTWVPAILLLLLQMMLAGSFTFIRENMFLIPAITLHASVQVLLAACTMLALSSLSNSSRYVGILYVGSGVVHRCDVQHSAPNNGRDQHVVGVLPGKRCAGRGRDFPAATPLRHALGRFTAGDRRVDRRLDGRSGTAGPRRGGRDMTAPLVAANHLSKWYGQVIGLNDVSVDVPRG